MKHVRWNTTYFKEGHMQEIVQDIAEKAQGVFLWVFLVTRSLRDGLTNGDTILDFQKRLRGLPPDLERFFKLMLDAIDPLYHEKMARLLQIAANGKRPLQFLLYCMHESEYEDKDYALKHITNPLSFTEVETLHDQCQRRINARCGGLLLIRNRRVEFLHRTVRDFLLTREMSEYLPTKSGSDFLVNLSTFRGYVCLLKSHKAFLGTDTLAEAFEYAANSLDESLGSIIVLLNAIEDTFSGFINGPNTDYFDFGNLDSDYFLSEEATFRNDPVNLLI
ncbi:uncharacterized protein TRUGW13939_01146 [Talaromyces rugulosus]|uniref:DUF7791 domain-containing protein n=1 Tax=Talaromyces rugulosus TaxID=121627 RepID=A0A7H8QLG5_TALRU|nr:uncharacterized protein TRUGW13939_01146 [Talaromyces rugulosus]QKX54063.1 hypothetical protein TRUGW13939_01146 [Talaromyces rugulosus]